MAASLLYRNTYRCTPHDFSPSNPLQLKPMFPLLQLPPGAFCIVRNVLSVVNSYTNIRNIRRNMPQNLDGLIFVAKDWIDLEYLPILRSEQGKEYQTIKIWGHIPPDVSD